MKAVPMIPSPLKVGMVLQKVMGSGHVTFTVSDRKRVTAIGERNYLSINLDGVESIDTLGNLDSYYCVGYASDLECELEHREWLERRQLKFSPGIFPER